MKTFTIRPSLSSDSHRLHLLAHGAQEVQVLTPTPTQAATPSCNADLLVAEELGNGGPKLRRGLLNPAGSKICQAINPR